MTGPVIAYCGNFLAPESTENHWRFAFEQLGCEFVPVQQQTASEEEWEAAASESDLALWSTTWGWPLPGTVDTWKRLQARGVRTASLHLDLVIGLQRELDVLTYRTHPQFYGPEIVWTSDGGHQLKWEQLGVRDHRWLAPAIHEPNALIGVPRPEYECSVLFLGSVAGYHPEHQRRRDLVAAARDRWPGRKFHTHGNEWSNTVRGPALADVVASAEVVLGDSLCLNGAADVYQSDRTTEVAGRAGLLVHPWNGASDFLDGCAQWSDADWSIDKQLDLVEEVLAWSPQKKHNAKMRAHWTVLEKHTYTLRARDVLRAFSLCEDCEDEAA